MHVPAVRRLYRRRRRPGSALRKHGRHRVCWQGRRQLLGRRVVSRRPPRHYRQRYRRLLRGRDTGCYRPRVDGRVQPRRNLLRAQLQHQHAAVQRTRPRLSAQLVHRLPPRLRPRQAAGHLPCQHLRQRLPARNLPSRLPGQQRRSLYQRGYGHAADAGRVAVPAACRRRPDKP